MIKVNINPGASYTAIAPASQYDVGRELIFTIYDGSSAVSLPSGAQVIMVGTKPSGLGFTTQGTIAGNQVTVVTSATMTEEAGHIPAELRFSYNGNNIGTANFIFAVEGSPHTNDTTDGDAETAKDLMTRAEEAVTEAESAAQTAAAQAAKAEAAAEAISQAGIDTTGATAGQVPTANGDGSWSWQDQQGGGGGSSSDDITNESNVSGATVTAALSSLNDQIANLEGGAPTPAATVSAMVDTTKIYLYTGSETGYNAGHWYYHSNGAWVDGGAYGEAASMSAGVKAALLACFQKVAWIDDQGQTYYENLYNELYPPANLVSITAVYTQSGTVYSTATLNDLRADLVVNANYDDGSSKTITDYVLSGTLSSAVSVITVSALGKETTFTVNVTEPIDYNRNPLDGATWRSGTSYNGTTGEEQSMANNHSTTKFTAQDCMYLLKNTDSNNTWVQLLAWDANGNFLGTMRNDLEALIKLNGNGQYAIVCANSSGNFDSTTISLMPKDNTSSTVPTLEINLNDYISDIKYTNASYYEVNISSALTNAGFTNANHKTTVKDCNVQMPITPQSINQAFKDQDGLHAWFYTWGILLFGIKGVPYKDINALSAYLGSNNVTLKFN